MEGMKIYKEALSFSNEALNFSNEALDFPNEVLNFSNEAPGFPNEARRERGLDRRFSETGSSGAMLFEAESGKTRVEICLSQEDALRGFEERIIAGGSCKWVLPCAMTSENGGRVLLYDATGFIPLSKYRIKQLDEALEILYTIPMALYESEDILLTSGRFFLDEGLIFVSGGTCGEDSGCAYAEVRPETKSEVRFVYGSPRKVSRSTFRDNYIRLIEAFGACERIMGLPSAAKSVLDSIDSENPGLVEIMKIVETARRKWTLVNGGS